MYSLKVSNIEVNEELKEEASQLADALAQNGVQEPDAPLDDVLDFSAGNPRVEHVTGSIHLYRSMPSLDKDARNTDTTLPVRVPVRAAVPTRPMASGGAL